jgi:hypothetical protein
LDSVLDDLRAAIAREASADANVTITWQVD